MKAKYILTAVFSAALLSSCSDFLDVQKEGDPTTTLYFTNDDQAVELSTLSIDRFIRRTSSVANFTGSRAVRATSFGAVRAAILLSPTFSIQAMKTR